MRNKSYQKFLEAINADLANKQAERDELEKQSIGLASQLVLAESRGDINKAAEIRLKLSPFNREVHNLEAEIKTLQAGLAPTQEEVQRELDENRMLELAKQAKSERGNYERIWKEIHATLEKMGPEMVGAYKRWHDCSQEFYSLLRKYEPGVKNLEQNAQNDLLYARAESFLVDLEENGIDLATLLGWWDIAGGMRKRFNLAPLDGPYVIALDFAHEVAQYGQALDPGIVREFGIKHTKGAWNQYYKGQGMSRPIFPFRKIEGSLPKIQYNNNKV